MSSSGVSGLQTQHKKRNSLDNNQVSSSGQQQQHQQQLKQGYFNGPGGPVPQYTSNAQKQRQVSYSPFSASTKANNSSNNMPHSNNAGAPSGGTLGKIQQGYTSSQQQQMMLMMQQIQKSQMLAGNPQHTSSNGGGASPSFGPQNPHHNRSESATPTPGGGLDRNLIDFMTAKHHNHSLHQQQQPGEKKVSSTPQPPGMNNNNISSSHSTTAFNKKKKSQQLPVTNINGGGGYGSIIIGAHSHNTSKEREGGLMGFGGASNQGLAQKRNSMNEAEQRRKQNNMILKKQQQQYNMPDDKQRPIRSANTSPTPGHHNFLINGVTAGNAQPSHTNGGLNLQEMLTNPQSNVHGNSMPGRPATGILAGGNSDTSKSSPHAVSGNTGTQKYLQQQRPKTSNKVADNYYQSSSQNAQINLAGRPTVNYPGHHKSVSEDTNKRMLKKNTPGTTSSKGGQLMQGYLNSNMVVPSSKSSTRPTSSGQKKGGARGPPSQTPQPVQYDSSTQQQQQLMMMLMQQQQSKVKSISDSHRGSSSQSNTHGVNQKINNFVDAPLVQTSKETESKQPPKVNQSTDFAMLNNNKMIAHPQMNSKFQSAPSTPTKMLQEVPKPQLIERNVITKYAFATRVGYIPNNPNKVNQDSFILSPNLGGCNFRHYFGVCDGHGQNGKEASHYIKVRLPQLLSKRIEDHVASNGQGEAARMSPNHEEYKAMFHKCFIQCNEELDTQNFDVNLSGSTVCTVLFNGTKVYCGNAGDSRAIKVAFNNQQEPHFPHHNNSSSLTRATPTKKNPLLDVTPLNRDHKPELKDEAERIHKRGGRIDSFRDYYNGGEPIGPQRVWLAHEEVPGLAMSRSMGDKVAHSVGVTAEPETWEFTLGLNDRYLVIASDGVWEFLSNEDIANIVYPFFEQNAPEAAANAVVKAAFKKWKQEEEVIDDITVVIIFLEPSMAYNSLRKSQAGPIVQPSKQP